MHARIIEFKPRGLILKTGWRRYCSIAYGEILTAERLRSGRGICLHTRTTEPVRLRCSSPGTVEVEDSLRAYGVRVVDCWGALITPTLADFEDELARSPGHVRQSSDNA
jgi:hypothetical protein